MSANGTKKATHDLIVVEGGNGGVGKSMTTASVIDWKLNECGAARVTVIETDALKPDVAKSMRGDNRITIHPINFSEEGGLINAGSIIEDTNGTSDVIINCAAGLSNEIAKFEAYLREPAEKIGLRPILLFPMNRQRDSIEILSKLLKSLNETSWRVVALKNTYFGAAPKFTLFDDSKISERIAATVAFPELNDIVVEKISSNRLNFWNANEGLKIAEQSALARFRREAYVAISEAINGGLNG